MSDRPIEERLEMAFGTDMIPAERSWLDGRVRAALATAQLARPSRKRFAGGLLLVGVLLVLAPAVLAVGTGILPLRDPNPSPSAAAASVAPSQRAGALSLTLYAHLEGTVNPTKPYPEMQWFAMARGGNVDPSQAVGFDYDGVGCLDVETGDELGLYDRNPADPSATRSQLVAAVEQTPVVVWVDIAQSGSLTEGTGVPNWWAGPAQECGGASPAAATPTPTASVSPSPVPSIAEDAGCGPSTIEVPDASFVPYAAQGRPGGQGGLIESAPPATVSDGQAAGFRAYLPKLAGYYYSYLIQNTAVFMTYLSRNPITPTTHAFPFLPNGGLTIREVRDGAEAFETELSAHLDRVTAVPIGSYSGYVRHEDEVLPGFRPFLVMWTQGTTLFEMHSGVATAADAVNLARSTVCTGATQSPVPSVQLSRPDGIHVANQTRLAVTLVVNGMPVTTVAPRSRTVLVSAVDLPSLPWMVEARTQSGRLLTSMTVREGDVVTTPQSSSGDGTRVDLSCGRLDVYAGPPMEGPAPGPGTPGDCEP